MCPRLKLWKKHIINLQEHVDVVGAAVKANWDKAVAPIMRCGGGNIDCNKDSNCVLAGDIICRKLADVEMYEEACRYAADLNMEVVEKYKEA